MLEKGGCGQPLLQVRKTFTITLTITLKSVRTSICDALTKDFNLQFARMTFECVNSSNKATKIFLYQ